MNKAAIKNFALWARNKLIADVRYRAGLVGITEKGIQDALPQSNSTTEFYDIGTTTPYTISGQAVRQRRNLTESIRRRAADADYDTAYKYIIEEVAYTWFNRLIAVRFMEINDYLPGRVRVLSSDSGKIEPDLVTTPFDAGLSFTAEEEQTILQLKQDNKLDELFRLMFIKQCNALHDILPALFERTEDYTELLLNLSVVDQDGVIWHLTHDIPEDDFNVEKGGQVEIIGWLYQYYNTEPKAQVFARPSGQKIKKEEIPAATQLFTPDWIVRYMVENSLGRLWLEGHPNEELRADWKYYLDEAEQEPEVQAQLEEIRVERRTLNPEDIKIIDPCMGSGHILVYAFDVLMQIYQKAGWELRNAARSIVENNLYGLDIDKRAYQLAYFAMMMKARQYDRRFLTRGIEPNVYEVQASGWIGGKYPFEMGNFLLSKDHQDTLNYLLEVFRDAKEYGSLLRLEQRDYAGLLDAWKYTASQTAENVNMVLWYSAVEEIVPTLIKQAIVLTQKYDVVITNPPYMGSSGMSGKLSEFVKKNYPDSKSDASTAFMEQTIWMCNPSGFMAMINIPVWMFLSSYEKLREKIISNYSIISMVHPGRGIFGSDFGTTTFVIAKQHFDYYTGTYRRLFDKQGEVKSIEERKQAFLLGIGSFTARQDNFSKIPGSPVAYWVSERVLYCFKTMPCLGKQYTLLAGTSTGDNNSYQRNWHEVSIKTISRNHEDRRWYPCNTGGEFHKYSLNCNCVIDWENDGFRIKNHVNSRGKIGSAVRNRRYFFKEGLTWNKLSSANFGVRYVPNGYISDDTARMIVTESNDSLFCLLGFLSSNVCKYFLTILSPTMSFTNSELQRIPLSSEIDVSKAKSLAEHNYRLSIEDRDSFEISWDFTCHPLVRCAPFSIKEMAEDAKHHIRDMNYIEEAFTRWGNECYLRFHQLKANEEELNRIFSDIYGLQDELTPEVDDKDVTVRRADLGRDIRSLLSYAVGCMFGRYSLDVPGLAYAGGDFNSVYRRDRLVDENGNPITLGGISISVSKDYTYISRDGKWIESAFPVDGDNIIPITDEAYLEDDIVKRLCEWLRVVYGPDTLEENLDFIAKSLGNKGATSREVIRNYFLKDFFADHCKIYQKRPIYWLFDSGKQNGFKALVYLHRYTTDTIGKLRVDYLHRLQRVYTSEIERMQDMIDNSKNQREVTISAKRKEKLQKQLKECQEYDEKIALLALARIELDLDDGVKVNYEKVQTVADGKTYPVLGKI